MLGADLRVSFACDSCDNCALQGAANCLWQSFGNSDVQNDLLIGVSRWSDAPHVLQYAGDISCAMASDTRERDPGQGFPALALSNLLLHSIRDDPLYAIDMRLDACVDPSSIGPTLLNVQCMRAMIGAITAPLTAPAVCLPGIGCGTASVVLPGQLRDWTTGDANGVCMSHHLTPHQTQPSISLGPLLAIAPSRSILASTCDHKQSHDVMPECTIVCVQTLMCRIVHDTIDTLAAHLRQLAYTIWHFDLREVPPIVKMICNVCILTLIACPQYGLYAISGGVIRILHFAPSHNQVKSFVFSLVFLNMATLLPYVYCAPEDKDWDKLPNMTEWDGVPYHDFEFLWWAMLETALASTVQDGYSLINCAKDEDGVLSTGNKVSEAPTAGDTNDDAKLKEKHRIRKQRLAACILRYIKTGCYLYRFIKKGDLLDYGTAGVAIYNYVKEVGKLKRTQDQVNKLKNTWDEATMLKVGIRISDDAIFRWRDWVSENVITLDRAGIHMNSKSIHDKFMTGFPEGFDSALMPDRMAGGQGLYLWPPHYPPHHPKAGQVCPAHNSFSIDKAAESLYEEWSRRVNLRLIRNPPSGSARQVKSSENSEDENASATPSAADIRAVIDASVRAAFRTYASDSNSSDDEDETVKALQRKIGPDDICGICGGRGHFGTIPGTNKKCLTLELGNKIPKDELMQTKYPRNLKFPNFNKGAKTKFAESSADAAKTNLRRQARSPGRKGKQPYKPKKRFDKRNANTADADAESVSSAASSTDSDNDEVNKMTSLALNYDHIVVTPPPSPPHTDDDDDGATLCPPVYNTTPEKAGSSKSP